MRASTLRVFNAWINQENDRQQNSVWTNGDDIYSYGTVIVSRVDDEVIFNSTRYSNTTTRHQNGIALLLKQSGIDFTEVGAVPIGTKGYALVAK
jgi:hypothetical protein